MKRGLPIKLAQWTIVNAMQGNITNISQRCTTLRIPREVMEHDLMPKNNTCFYPEDVLNQSEEILRRANEYLHMTLCRVKQIRQEAWQQGIEGGRLASQEKQHIVLEETVHWHVTTEAELEDAICRSVERCPASTILAGQRQLSWPVEARDNDFNYG